MKENRQRDPPHFTKLPYVTENVEKKGETLTTLELKIQVGRRVNEYCHPQSHQGPARFYHFPRNQSAKTQAAFIIKNPEQK